MAQRCAQIAASEGLQATMSSSWKSNAFALFAWEMEVEQNALEALAELGI